MARLVILTDTRRIQRRFEQYCAERHLPFAQEKMPNLTGAETGRVVGGPDGERSPYYRIAAMPYHSVEDLHQGLGSKNDRPCWPNFRTSPPVG